MNRIIGGVDAAIEEYPFAVSLQNNGTFFGHDVEHFCGGSIIADTWIVTSAQCALSILVREFHVRAGSKYYYKEGSTYEVERIVVHPNFNYQNYDFDVGLVKLKSRIIFDNVKQPIKLPEKTRTVPTGTEIGVIGWGATKNLGVYSEVLKRSSLPKISNEECVMTYEYHVTEQMFCIVSEDRKPCVGDAGSPAVLEDTLIGVASWSEACAFSYPTAYATVSVTVDWIKEVTGID